MRRRSPDFYTRKSAQTRALFVLSLLEARIFLQTKRVWFHQVMEVLGLLDITGESLWIGILCSLVALPLNLLWIFLFRYSRVSHIYYLTSYKFIWFKNQRYFFFRFATLIEISLKLKSKASCNVMIPKRCLWANRVTQFLSCENSTRSCK